MTMWRLKKALKRMKKRDRAERRRDGSSSDSSDSSLSSDSDSSSLSSRSRSRSPPRDGKPKPRYHNGRPQFDEQTRAQQLGQNVKRPAVQEVTPTMRTLHAPRPKVVLKPRDEKRVASIALNKEITDRNATYKSILNLFDRRGAEFDGVNLSTAVHRLGSRFARSRNIRTDGTVRQLIDRATQLIGEGHATYGARETANTAWGVTKMGLDAPALEAIVDLCRARTAVATAVAEPGSFALVADALVAWHKCDPSAWPPKAPRALVDAVSMAPPVFCGPLAVSGGDNWITCDDAKLYGFRFKGVALDLPGICIGIPTIITLNGSCRVVEPKPGADYDFAVESDELTRRLLMRAYGDRRWIAAVNRAIAAHADLIAQLEAAESESL